MKSTKKKNKPNVRVKPHAFLDLRNSSFKLNVYLDTNHKDGPDWSISVGELKEAKRRVVQCVQGNPDVKYVVEKDNVYFLNPAMSKKLLVGKAYYFMFREKTKEDGKIAREAYTFSDVPSEFMTLGNILYKIFRKEFKLDLEKFIKENPEKVKEFLSFNEE